MFEDRTYCECKRTELFRISIPQVYHYNPPSEASKQLSSIWGKTHIGRTPEETQWCYRNPAADSCSALRCRAPLRTLPSARSGWWHWPSQVSGASPNCKSASARQVWMCKRWSFDWGKLLFWNSHQNCELLQHIQMTQLQASQEE